MVGGSPRPVGAASASVTKVRGGGGLGGSQHHLLPKLPLCGCQDRSRRAGMLGVPWILRLCGIRRLFPGPLWCQASWTKGFLPCREGCLYSKAPGTLDSIPLRKGNHNFIIREIRGEGEGSPPALKKKRGEFLAHREATIPFTVRNHW